MNFNKTPIALELWPGTGGKTGQGISCSHMHSVAPLVSSWRNSLWGKHDFRIWLFSNNVPNGGS